MQMLSDDPRTIFMGQAVKYAGTGMYETLTMIPDYKKIELPVAENLQMGISIGYALNGFIPISIFPRWNFLLSATDQIINHLDKIKLISDDGYQPNVIIRTSVGTISKIDPQEQHKGNFSAAFRSMVKTIEVIELFRPEEIVSTYKKALNRKDGRSTILVEFADFML